MIIIIKLLLIIISIGLFYFILKIIPIIKNLTIVIPFDSKFESNFKKTNDISNINNISQQNIKNILIEWYSKYNYELKQIHKIAVEFCKLEGVKCLSDDLEIEITYMRIRETKPTIIWEISPSHGYSTLWILAAIKENKKGKLLSFDIHDKVLQYVPKSWSDLGWILVIGDFKENFLKYTEKYTLPDYIFLDSFHSFEFGKFYSEIVFPFLMKKKSFLFVSLHDVFNPSFWTDGVRDNLREKAGLPEWMANEEGQVVLNWLAFHSTRYKGLFTVARSFDSILFENIIKIRGEILGTDFANQIPNSNRPMISIQNNPTIYFTLMN